jgi:putative membrane protein insertion efficiency factor
MPPSIEGPQEEDDVSSAARSEPRHASAARAISSLLRQAVREARVGWGACASEARAAVVRVLCVSIRVYQCLLSPLLGNCCRFEPSCSRYALLCIERLGPIRGSWLSLRRLLRCHPFCPGGHDPPPEVTS